MAKIRKKYNNNKRFDICATALCRDILLVYTGHNSKEFMGFDKKTGERITKLDQAVFNALFTGNFKWVYQLDVFCRTQTGDEYKSTMEVGAPHPCLHKQLFKSLNETHKHMIQSCNPLHVINIGYIAGISIDEFDQEILNKIYQQLDVYSPVSKWEYEHGALDGKEQI